VPEAEARYKVRFADETKKEFRKLGHAARVDILAAIQKKLTTNPEGYGEPLGRDPVGSVTSHSSSMNGYPYSLAGANVSLIVLAFTQR
jgi:hypothetical protein